MNEFIKTFLSGIGITDEVITALTAEDKADDFSVTPFIDNYQSVQEKLFENKHKDRIVEQSDLDKKFDILRGTHAQKINKEFGLGFTRKDLEEMKYEDVVIKAAEQMNTSIESARGKNDKQLVEQVKTLQIANAEALDANQALNEKMEADFGKLKSDYDNQLNEVQVGQLFKTEYEKYTFGLDTELIPMVKAQVEREVRNLYDVKSDGSITGKDGTHAQDFEGKGIYETVGEPVKFLLNKYKAIAKQKIVDEKVIKTPEGKFVKENLSPAASAMLNAARNGES